MLQSESVITSLSVTAYTVPTDAPEADGTLDWNSTTIVVVEIQAGDIVGLGYTYADSSTALLIEKTLARVVLDKDATDINLIWLSLHKAIRNLGSTGISAMAISGVDNALWDLKAKLLGCSLLDLLGPSRHEIDVYGSGGFTSYDDQQLRNQLGGWAAQGIKYVKMKVGTHPEDDLRRVRLAREAIGPDIQLFVDANGAYTTKQALSLAEKFADAGVVWFEEPRPSDDLNGLRRVRDRTPAAMEIAAGEYGYNAEYFKTMLESGAVDVLQADATRCAGVTGFLAVSALCESWKMPLSAHCAPQLHATLCCSARPARHLEYFHDHARIENMLFEGAIQLVDGRLRPDRSRPGLGLELKRSSAERYRTY